MLHAHCARVTAVSLWSYKRRENLEFLAFKKPLSVFYSFFFTFPIFTHPMSVPFILPRFSGSTLEPSTEPIVIYPGNMLRKDPVGFNGFVAAPTNIAIEPTRPTPPLKRKNKPAFITIPPAPTFAPLDQNEDAFSPWSFEMEAAPELLWDDESQTIYKSQSIYRRPSSIPSANWPLSPA
ncbi:hypothetical protein BX666DRAFT_1907612 [Dichotomocladium elegans]|nr:hypothetical protein BX666DRAFT_1907612 [Dichotomocladium elegans]